MSISVNNPPSRLFRALAQGEDYVVASLVTQLGGPEQVTSSLVNMTARRGHLKCLKVLKRSGVAMKQRDTKTGLNPMDEAASRDHMEVVDWLLKQKLLLSEVAPDGLRAIDRMQDEVFRQTYLTTVVNKEIAQANALALNKALPKRSPVKKPRF